MIILTIGIPKLGRTLCFNKKTIKQSGLMVCCGAFIDFQATCA